MMNEYQLAVVKKYDLISDYIQIFCNDRRNTFDFACRKWYLNNNSER